MISTKTTKPDRHSIQGWCKYLGTLTKDNKTTVKD